MVQYTSIQLLPETRKQLALLKEGPRETYDEIITKLLKLVPERDEEGNYTDEFRVGLLNAMIDVRAGKTVKLSEVKKSLGLD
jgi:hypothetical protein